MELANIDPRPTDPDYIIWRQDKLEEIAREAQEADNVVQIAQLVKRLSEMPLYQRHSDQFPNHYLYEQKIIDFLKERKQEIIDKNQFQ